MAQARARSSPAMPFQLPPSPHALAQGTDIGHDHRAGVRQRLAEHAALRSERRVGQDRQAAASEEVHYLLLVDEPVDQLDAPWGQAAGKVPDLLEERGSNRLPGDRQVALGEQLQGPQQDVQTLIWSDRSEEQQPLARPINRPHRPNRRRPAARYTACGVTWMGGWTPSRKSDRASRSPSECTSSASHLRNTDFV